MTLLSNKFMLLGVAAAVVAASVAFSPAVPADPLNPHAHMIVTPSGAITTTPGGPSSTAPGSYNLLPWEIDLGGMSTYQNIFTVPNPSGGVSTFHRNPAGVLIAAYRTFTTERVTDQAPQHTISFGGWYWYNGGSGDQSKFSTVLSYGLTDTMSLQANVGGDTQYGFNEEYGFVEYSPSIASKFGITVGLGPYYKSRDVEKETFDVGGSPVVETAAAQTKLGITALGGADYELARDLSLTGNIWYVNYDNKYSQLGIGSHSVTDTRYTIGFGYQFK